MNHQCESCKRPLVTPGHCSTCIADLTRHGGYQEYDTETGRYTWRLPEALKVPDWEVKIGTTSEGVPYAAEATFKVEEGAVMRMDPLTVLQDEIAAWADQHYPDRTYHNAMTKLVMEEVPEVLRHPSDPMEWADVFILLLDAAKLQGVDIAKAVRDKMEINRRRSWAVDPSTGVMRHVR